MLLTTKVERSFSGENFDRECIGRSPTGSSIELEILVILKHYSWIVKQVLPRQKPFFLETQLEYLSFRKKPNFAKNYPNVQSKTLSKKFIEIKVSEVFLGRLQFLY